MDSDSVIGLSPERFDAFDFINVATTHFHHMLWGASGKLSCGELARRWIERFDAVLNSGLPFGKVGIAHLACGLINSKSREGFLETLRLIPQDELDRLFSRAADLGLGIELNSDDMRFKDNEKETVLRPFFTAKSCGCKFYLGGDAHSRRDMYGTKEVFERAITLLDLKESDKFVADPALRRKQ